MAMLRELALRTLLPAFAGPRPPAWALRLVEEGLGGFTFFGFNIVDAAAGGQADRRDARRPEPTSSSPSTRRAATSPGSATRRAAPIRATPRSARSTMSS